MGGVFGVLSTKKNVVLDTYLGTDYHSHLGTGSAGLAWYHPQGGLQRKIHNINNAPFRSKFEKTLRDACAQAAIGTINDTDPQPLLVYSKFGNYAIAFVGIINNVQELVDEYISRHGSHFTSQSNGSVNTTELLAAYINLQDSLEAGIVHVWQKIRGTALIVILTAEGKLILARDKFGRLPLTVAESEDGYAFAMENFAYQKLAYKECYNLGAGEIVELSCNGLKVLKGADTCKRICSFLWTYYGYPASGYENRNVEEMRYCNGRLMCRNDKRIGKTCQVDCVAGVPDSGTAHAIGYAFESNIPFTRPFIKYTPTWSRSFMPANQMERNQVAKMKMLPVPELIENKKLLFVDDSIVRGTQLRESVDFLYENGAAEIHVRSACPPIMYPCKFLNFSRSTSEDELITRRLIKALEGEAGLDYLDEYRDPETERGRNLRSALAEELGLASVEFQTLEALIEAIGLERDEVCTYCWDGRE